jgi:hypothetical protein
VTASIVIVLGPAVRVTAKRWYQITSAAGRRAAIQAAAPPHQLGRRCLRRAAANPIVVGEMKEVLMMRIVVRVIQAGTCDVPMAVPRLVIGRLSL